MTKGAANNLSFIEPMKALRVRELPVGNWLYELKFDGYRALAFNWHRLLRKRPWRISTRACKKIKRATCPFVTCQRKDQGGGAKVHAILAIKSTRSRDRDSCNPARPRSHVGAGLCIGIGGARIYRAVATQILEVVSAHPAEVISPKRTAQLMTRITFSYFGVLLSDR
jgi:hypothetical protein